jgi:hypothetical protein
MRGRIAGLATLVLLIAAGVAVAQSTAYTPGEEKPEDYPNGPGREDTFYACTP